MDNFVDYLHWRGDIRFTELGLNNADVAVISCMAHFPFWDIVPEDFDCGRIPLMWALNRVQELCGKDGDGRSHHRPEDPEILEALLDSPRFMELTMSGYTVRYDKEESEQFCAFTLELPNDDIMVVYRGTDYSLAGWKENFSMSFLEKVPAQAHAAEYLEVAAKKRKGNIYVVGHSKGGNLAMYAAIFCSKRVKKRIVTVRNLDGPGFLDHIIRSPEYQEIKDRIETFVPQSSIIGRLLGHDENCTVIHSGSRSILQHFPYNWEIRRDDFVECRGTTDSSRIIDDALKKWLEELDNSERTLFVEGLFSILKATGEENIADMLSPRNVITVISAYRKLDDETKNVIKTAYKLLRDSYKDSKEALEEEKAAEKADSRLLSEVAGPFITAVEDEGE